MLVVFLKSMVGGGKVQVVTDEWRNEDVEERLRYSLVKVHLVHHTLTLTSLLFVLN